MFGTNEDACSLCEAKVRTHSATGSAGNGDSPSNKEATVIGHLTSCDHLLCKACRPKFTKFGATSASVGPDKPLHGHCPLCGEYVKPARLDTKSGYSDDPAQGFPRRKLKARYSGPRRKVKALISSLFKNQQVSMAGNPRKRFVYTLPSFPI